MCKAMEERIAKERIQVLTRSIENSMKNLNMTAEQVMFVLDISDEDREILIQKF